MARFPLTASSRRPCYVRGPAPGPKPVNHVITVERVIGFRRGTGGTPGVQYLRRMPGVELFPELWHVCGEL